MVLDRQRGVPLRDPKHGSQSAVVRLQPIITQDTRDIGFGSWDTRQLLNMYISEGNHGGILERTF